MYLNKVKHVSDEGKENLFISYELCGHTVLSMYHYTCEAHKVHDALCADADISLLDSSFDDNAAHISR